MQFTVEDCDTEPIKALFRGALVKRLALIVWIVQHTDQLFICGYVNSNARCTILIHQEH